jgi:hypothetical protein
MVRRRSAEVEVREERVGEFFGRRPAGLHRQEDRNRMLQPRQLDRFSVFPSLRGEQLDLALNGYFEALLTGGRWTLRDTMKLGHLGEDGPR